MIELTFPEMECQACRQRLKPDDPRQPFFVRGRYLKPICFNCNNYSPRDSYPEAKEEYWSKRQWDTVNQLRAGYLHLHKEVMEQLAPKVGKQKKGRIYKYE